MTDLGFQKQPSVALLADQYYTELDGGRKLSSGSNEPLRESLLVELVEGGSLTELHKLNSLFSPTLCSGSLPLIYLLLFRVLSVLLSSSSRSLPFLRFLFQSIFHLAAKMWFSSDTLLSQSLLARRS